MPASSLVARDITKSYGAAVVLDRVGLAVGPRDRIGVLGPNGTGKTTLLRILAGLDPAEGGRVARLPATATVGYLPQEPDRREGETLLAFLARHSGVAEAERRLERTSGALGAATADTADAPHADASALNDAYSAALDRYLALGGPDFESRAAAVCADLGMADDRLSVPTTVLSGGETARTSLAAILLTRFDVLLLDEPTNDLDFDGLDRLERFLVDLAGALVVVSHDRAFLEHTVTSVVELDEATHTATRYEGGWTAYLGARATARRHAEEAYSGYRAEHLRLSERARRQRQWATQGARRARSKAPDPDKAQRDWQVNRTEKQASKVRTTEQALERLGVVDKPWEGWQLELSIAAAPRSGDVVLRMTAAVIERGAFRLGPVDLEVRWAERVALLGANGAGKTALLQALLGRIPLAAGERMVGPSVVVGELDQARRQFASQHPLLETFVAASDMLAREARSLLAKFALTAAHVDRPAATLSPGERTRASLALLMARGVNCLVLDEPTNHLDLPAIEQLEQALATYDGTLVLVTHDRRLLDAVEITRTLRL